MRKPVRALVTLLALIVSLFFAARSSFVYAGSRPTHGTGSASWYEGRQGACGPLVGDYAAAHRSQFPCGAKVMLRSYNRKTGRAHGHVLVTILDRGPPFDLAPRAFEKVCGALSMGRCGRSSSKYRMTWTRR